MRSFLLVSAAALGLSACAGQPPAPAQPAAAARKSPQCWNGDAGQFMDVGTHATISGVDVSCETTSDGKNAQWMGRPA